MLRRDTAIALEILRKGNGGLIAWHDYHHEFLPNDWFGVARVVADRHSVNPGNVWAYKDSVMAFERIPAS